VGGVMRQVDSKLYDKKYFLDACGGHKEFSTGSVCSRIRYAIELCKLKSSDTVLDYGCGRGELCLAIANKVKTVIGIDYSQDAIDVANSLLSDSVRNVAFFKENEKTLPLKDNSVDVIFFLDVVEHLYPEENKLIVKEFYRVLKPGGRVITHTTPNKEIHDLRNKYMLLPKYLLYLPMKLIGKTVNLSVDNRSEYEKAFHVNEQTQSMLRELFEHQVFGVRVWAFDGFVLPHERQKWHERYLSLVSWIRYFGRKKFIMNLWAIAIK
jgi:ubiquinone/menaquinone biosynthesis C-methylase UbiE